MVDGRAPETNREGEAQERPTEDADRTKARQRDKTAGQDRPGQVRNRIGRPPIFRRPASPLVIVIL